MVCSLILTIIDQEPDFYFYTMSKTIYYINVSLYYFLITRIPENFRVIISNNGHWVKTSWLFNSLKINSYAFHHKIVYDKG